jgi:hypothetical protein
MMGTASLIRYSLAAVVTGTMALSGAAPSSAAPVLSSTAAVKAAAPDQVIDVGYYYQDYGGAWINGPLAVGFLGASVVSPFYYPVSYPPYVYAAPPVYYTPPLYYSPAVVYGRPLLAPDPYYPSLYPYVRSNRYYGIYRGYGRTWASYPYRGYRGHARTYR